MAYYALLKLHILPHELLAMSGREKAFVVAAVQKKCRADEKQAKQLSGSASHSPRRGAHRRRRR